jgi:hypothetical protein
MRDALTLDQRGRLYWPSCCFGPWRFQVLRVAISKTRPWLEVTKAELPAASIATRQISPAAITARFGPTLDFVR